MGFASFSYLPDNASLSLVVPSPLSFHRPLVVSPPRFRKLSPSLFHASAIPCHFLALNIISELKSD